MMTCLMPWTPSSTEFLASNNSSAIFWRPENADIVSADKKPLFTNPSVRIIVPPDEYKHRDFSGATVWFSHQFVTDGRWSAGVSALRGVVAQSVGVMQCSLAAATLA